MHDRPVLIIQHQAIGEPGTILETLSAEGVPFDLRRLHRGADLPAPAELAGYRALIVLGGSMNTDQGSLHPFLPRERRLQAAALEQDLPQLGICLGAQQLASVRGGRVFDREEPAVGWMAMRLVGHDLLFEGTPREFRALEWHAQSFTVPVRSWQVALRDGDVGVQAFRAGPRAWGLQFHPEIDEAMFDAWLELDNKGTRRRDPEILERLAWEREEILSDSRALCGRLVRNLLRAARGLGAADRAEAA
jgi:GMP synthase (glutamine-hydrolysing)